MQLKLSHRLFQTARHSIFCLLLLAVGLPSAQAAGNRWSAIRAPLAGPPQVIGAHAGGCLAGAMALPLVGEGYQAMRISRNRYYGHPMLVQFLERLGRYAESRGYRLLVGDMAQPRGGPMPGGHASHQSGLDADIWFLQQPGGRVLPQPMLETLGAPSMIVATEGVLNRGNWSSQYRDTLRQAALAPEVDRIFVNAIIKKALCERETDRDWLRKVRPWWGHDAHFHVRLTCPSDSPQCQEQKPIPLGDGCDPDLNNWVRDIVQAARYPKPARKRKPRAENLPAACYALLPGQSGRNRPAGGPPSGNGSNTSDAELMQ